MLFPFSVTDLMLALTEDFRSRGGLVGALVHEMPGGDPDDRHHAAAACAAGAVALVTCNLADFPAADMARLGVRVLDPDTYLRALHEQWPQEVTDTMARLVAGKRNPPVTYRDGVARLGKPGLTRFADRLGQTGDP